MSAEETDPRVRALTPVCEAVALLLGPHAEVVLHDPATDRVLAVWNPMTPRGPGDPSLLGELDALDPAARDVFGPYEKLLADGRRLSSVSAVLRDADGGPEAVLCVNLDRTPFERAAAVLSAFAAPTAPRPAPLFDGDWEQRVRDTVGAHVRGCGRPVERMTRADRLALVAALDGDRVFAVRRAVPFVTSALGVSRSTVYGLLAEARAAAGSAPVPDASEDPPA
ncbi:PAS domain-containing protein [Streptomyces sp. NPDC047002]|uniref:helix-turn-helix transcriptional regulator n=1 Tax=Streptomyces sp. NPDC047002 TaxID=3155475 RepID=UPI003455587E